MPFAAAVDNPSIVIAFGAGVASFLSPCVLPMVPGYLAAVTGTSPGTSEHRVDARVLIRAGLFVATFSAIFVMLGLGATAAGSFLRDNKPLLDKIAGIVIIVMGLLFLGSVFFLRLNREYRPHGLIERAGRGGPIVAGAAFAIAWTPCVGPTLAAILGLASTSSGTGRGALLLGFYSAGLAVPFLFSAVAFNAAQRSFAFFKRHYALLQATSGAVLVVIGVLIYSGQFTIINSQLNTLGV